MKQRGRRSAAANVIKLNAMGSPSKPTAPSFLSRAEASTFIELLAANPHLTATDTLLLACFVQAVAKTYRLAKREDVEAWERAARVAMALARSLRLTPQSTIAPQTVGRRRTDQPRGRAPWSDTEEEEEE